MSVKVKVRAIEHADMAWDGQTIASVGSRVTVVVDFWFDTDLRGGKFEVTHPGSDPVEFAVPDRKPTGGWRPGGRKMSSKDLPRVETMKCRVTFARVTAVPQPFTLVATANCATEANDDTTVRVYADEQALAAAMVVVRSGASATGVLSMARAGNSGAPSQHLNTVRSFTRFYGQLFFKDPDGVERPFPKDLPVKVMLGEHPSNAIDTAVGDDGKVTLEVIGFAEVIARKFLRLRFDMPTEKCVICEAPGGGATQTFGDAPTPTDAAGTYDKRFFSLPKVWTMRQTDWAVTADDGRWVADKAHFTMTRNGRAASLGKKDAPVKMVLDPHWQFLKFEFFDRYYGTSGHADQRKSLPPMLLVGDRSKPATATAFDEDVKSNWWIVEGGANVQCVPWIVQRKANGDADARPSTESILRFTNATNTCVESTSATDRKRVVATAEQLKPGHDRLKFYDLPTDWQSRNYYGALSTTDGEFGWYEDIADKPTAKGKPLVFSLDDIVLTDKDRRRLATWDNSKRLTMFINTFDATQGCSVEGVFDPDATEPWLTKALADTALEKDENYVVKQPLWVRLIVAAGNLFDVFDRRTEPSAVFDPSYDVIGARAAVNWVDATSSLSGMEVWDKPTPTGNYQIVPNGKPSAGLWLRNGRPARTDHGAFSTQPFFCQEYVTRQGTYDPNASGSTGRIDLALLRCCAVADRSTPGSEKEVAVQVYFLKQHLNYIDEPTGGRPAFQSAAHRALLDAWNGVTPAFGRATLVPKDPAHRMKTTVVTLHAFTEKVIAHYAINVQAGLAARNNRNGGLGTGLLADGKHLDRGGTNGFTNAHEHGHERALPDEYNERTSCASFRQASFGQHLPGDPYEMDGRGMNSSPELGSPMMNGNMQVQARYFWQSAEWVRRAVGHPFKVSFNGFDEYAIPPHPSDSRTHVFWPLIGQNNQVLAANAPLTANRGKFHLFLYPLGKDRFSVTALKARESPPGTTEYDGILMVPVLLKVSGPVQNDTWLKAFAQALASVGRRFGARKLNHRWYLTGTAAQGTPQEWTFRRCLIHFAPRLLVMVDVPTREQFLDLASPYDTEAVCTTFAGRLDTYHAVPHTPVATKKTALDPVKAAVAEPVLDVKGDWDTASAQIPTPPVPPPPTDGTPAPPVPPPPPVRPPAFSGIDTKVNEYGLLPADQFANRAAKLAELVQLCDSFTGANGASRYAPPAAALRGRAEQKRKCVEALERIRKVRVSAGTVQTSRTDHNETGQKVATKHGHHFEVTCVVGTAAPARWTIGAPIVEIPLSAAWLETVAAEVRTDSRVQTAVANLDRYHAAAREDCAARLNALDTLGTAAAAATVPPARGDWDTTSVVVGQSRPIGFAAIDIALGGAASKGTDERLARAEEYAKVNRLVDREVSICPEPFKQPARDLKARVTAARNEDLAMDALRKVEALAAPRKVQLQLEVASRKVTLTAPNEAAFEDALLEAFPSMFGIYKPADQITTADLTPLVTLLGLTNPVVHAI